MIYLKKIWRLIGVVFTIILGLGLAYIYTNYYFEGFYRSVVLLTDAKAQIPDSIDLAAVITGLFVFPTILAVAYLLAPKTDANTISARISPTHRTQEKLTVFSRYFISVSILAQMVLAFCAWWPRILYPYPSVFRSYDTAAIIDLVVAVLSPPLGIGIIALMYPLAWTYFRWLFGQPENKGGEDPASP